MIYKLFEMDVVIMGVKYIPTDEEIIRMRELAAKGSTMSTIAVYLGKDRCCIKRLLDVYNIIVKPSSENKKGRKFEWNSYKLRKLKEMYASEDFSIKDVASYFETSEKTVSVGAKELGISKVLKKFFSDKESAYLRLNAGKISAQEMSKVLGKNDWVIGKQLTKLGIVQRFKHKTMPPDTEEFNNEIGNPAYSDSYIGRKYGVASTTAKRWRTELFGTFQRMTDTWLNKSIPEMDFEDILNELGVAYLYEHKINKWKIDYSLGFNCLVEIYGSHWHDEVEKVIKSDQKKVKILESLGYEVLIVWDYELKDKTAVKSKVLQSLKKCTDRYFKHNGSLNLVNL